MEGAERCGLSILPFYPMARRDYRRADRDQAASRLRIRCALMPPTPRPFPSFIADASQEGEPYGRWADRLLEEFADAAEALADEAGAPLDREAVKWFPDRAGGRV